MFVVLAKPVDQAFVLNPEKAKEFLERKADPAVKAKILERAEKMRLQRERTQIEKLKEEINNHIDAMTAEDLEKILSYMQYLLYLQSKTKNSD